MGYPTEAHAAAEKGTGRRHTAKLHGVRSGMCVCTHKTCPGDIRTFVRRAPETFIWGGWGALGAPFPPPPPPTPREGGSKGWLSFFECFSCMFHDKTVGTATVCPCPCPCRCHCVTPRGGGGVGTRPWWLALLACGGAYWPLALEPSAMTSRHPYHCGHPHCRGHPPARGGIQNATSAHGVLP